MDVFSLCVGFVGGFGFCASLALFYVAGKESGRRERGSK